MTEFEKEEFWKALGRLYDTNVEQTKQIELLAAASKKHDERINALLIITERHDRRIRGLEGTDQA
jgi:hypothetical protein